MWRVRATSGDLWRQLGSLTHVQEIKAATSGRVGRAAIQGVVTSVGHVRGGMVYIHIIAHPVASCK